MGRRTREQIQLDSRKRNEAFSLLELLIVTAVLAVIMAIAIPSIISARISANESSAIASLKTLATANEQYRSRFNSYVDSLDRLAELGALDPRIAAGSKAGYVYNYWTAGEVWDLVAVPISPDVSGDRRFWIDHTGVIRFSHTGIPTSTDPPVD